MEQRETFSSRLGFILISAGCAIGLGNVWRFPYIVGKYGGAAFVLIYLFFLFLIGIPVLTMEFAVGRSSQKSAISAFRVLTRRKSKWDLQGKMSLVGNYLLLMFYTNTAGWVMLYVFKMLSGELSGKTAQEVSAVFSDLLASPWQMGIGMALAVGIGVAVCSRGLRDGVEKINKAMMLCLLVIMVVLCIQALSLQGASEGLAFYLIPDFKKMAAYPLSEVIYAAMSQAFFTLSVGMGSMEIFGSFIGKERSLLGEAVNVAFLDTLVALLAGCIIFPACFAFGVSVDEGVGLVFVTLPNVFNQMSGGNLWGALFFVLMSFAALSTVIAVFENILNFTQELWGWSRKKALLYNGIALFLLSIPCVLSSNVWNFNILGLGSIADVEDFLVSGIILPFGSFLFAVFCTKKFGWGFENYLQEANAGEGIHIPKWTYAYLRYVLPVIILVILGLGLVTKFM